jgi:hypothetical protein
VQLPATACNCLHIPGMNDTGFGTFMHLPSSRDRPAKFAGFARKAGFFIL